MTDIILLTALADADRVTPIIDALVEDRLDARWMPIGAEEEACVATAAEIDAARCVLIAWSDRTAAPDATDFQALASRAVVARKAVGVLVEPVTPPAGLGSTTLYNVSGWRARPARWRRWLGGGLYLRDVVSAAKYKVAGRDPAPPSAPRAMLVRQALATIPAIFALVALVPTLFGFWRDLNLTSGAEAAAWRTVDPANCAALRTFLGRYPDGTLAAQAQARLDGRTIAVETQWRPVTRKMPLYVGSGLAAPMPNDARAQGDLDRRTGQAADEACHGLAEAGQARFLRSEVLAGQRSCTTAADGLRCAFDGAVSCSLQEPVEHEIERCRARE